MRAVGAGEMRRIEQRCVQRGISLDTLMRRAGTFVARWAAAVDTDRPVLVLVGPGNNGGDGLIAAQALQAQRRNATVYTFHRRDLLGFEGRAVAAEDDHDLHHLHSLIADAGVVVDALLGIGQSRPPEGLLASIIETCNEGGGKAERIAVDIPTGVDADTGAVRGAAFRAHTTLCMGLAKIGAVVFPGGEYAGQVEVVDMGMPPDVLAGAGVLVSDAGDVATMLPRRSENSNKGSYGRVLVVAGSRDFMGAPGLVSIAALRAGCGLAEVASTADVCGNVAAHALEPIYLTLPETDGHIAHDAIEPIRSTLDRATALVFGPGLGSSDDILTLTRELLRVLEASGAPPAVIDADGLNALSRIEGWWHTGARLVLTPHPGEMGRLTRVPTAEIQKSRLAVVIDNARRWGKTVALKGAGTIVADPSGGVSINTTGSGNLATGGTGDVLSGIIGGLLAQGCDPWKAAVAGVYLHGLAGDGVRETNGLSGTLAGDLTGQIPLARMRILREAGVEET